MERENLHLLINEEIYLLPQDQLVEEQESLKEIERHEPKSISEEVQEPSNVSEPEPKLEAAPKKALTTEPQEEHPQESPHIPVHDLPESEALPFAVFHTSADLSENELLHKIIDACKIPEDQYKVFSHGFDQSVKFKKALVFVPEAKAFYTPIPYKGSEFLCSKPLDQISGNVQEKAKLWEALQKFVDTI